MAIVPLRRVKMRIIRKNKNFNRNLDEVWDAIIENSIATEDECRLVTSINGYSMRTLNDIIEARTGYHDIEQYLGEVEEDEDDFACGGKKHFDASEIDDIKADLLRWATQRAEFEGAPEELAIFKDAVNSSKATTEYDLLKELLMVSDKMVEEDYNLFHFDDLKFIPSDLTDAAWDKFGVEFLLYTDQANDEQEAYEKIRRIAPTPEFEKWCKKNNIALS